MFSSSAFLNERTGTAGGRAEGSGSTEEERTDGQDSVRQHDQVCVPTV